MTTHWILGPGAIGRLLAHSLAPFAEVALIGRRDLPAQQRLMTPEGEARTQRLSSLTAGQLAVDAPEPPALVHITTKAMSAEAALESVADSLSPITPLVLWQNGFLAQPRITQTWPGPVLCATTTEGAYLTGDDGVVHAGHGHTFLGDLNNHHGALAEELAQALTQAGLAATKVSDIRQRLWQKLAVNAAINPLVALNSVRNGELRGEAYAGRMVAVVKEVAAIMLAEGIAPPNDGNGEDEWLALVWQVVENTANNKASMLQDVEAKRPTERGAILGPLIESAQRHGLACEVLQALDNELAEVEASF
ncbi:MULTISPECIES: ketopantoate reductase family protein [Halomonadaceae]|jgi:2-dehydropantoate 2-reductase|uniref:ketopantoate reductase family protein n=1 Tax=Halomonadaceae TaxID=28256 RepID=UPI0012F4600A|nr:MULTISPECIES: 2-dehydropantoate 2-reductase [Halomonas]CAD5261873.1 2-dehydropantoate 2-reductase [Halomonas sp. 156]CAD5287102.1 2-dehydropantoate 2-reductase [Halomonas sp. 113]CAD5288656.1 2-dehydropantoate 2-reductase [Halomonas sp. 59]CAD5291649.1 2-dehydropantoate 2-reductase [Halomonas sp. I3]VXB40324.1 2-dehydropantoate 2-reductase [Halomonas titanicae]